MTLRIAVVCGGPSAEVDVSRSSASQVAVALRSRGHQCTILEVDAELWPALEAGGFDCVFIAVHGRFGEDGTVQGVCELLGLPYTGSGLLATALCFDKVAAKRLFTAEGIATPAWRTLPAAPASPDEIGPAMAGAAAELGYPLVVKPRYGGSTIGLSMVRDAEALIPAWETAAAHGEVLCEKFVAGIEVTVGILGDNPPGPFRPSRSSPNVPSTTMQRSTPRVRATMSSPPASPRRGVAPVRTPRSGRIAPWVAATSRGWTSSSTAAACPGCSR